MNDTFSKSVTFHVPTYVWDALNKRATEERRTVSNMLRLILEESLEAPVDGVTDSQRSKP